MLDVLMKYKITDVSDTLFCLEQPIFETNNYLYDVCTHAYDNIIKIDNPYLVINLKNINEYILQNMFDNKKIYMKKSTNFHYIMLDDLIVKESNEKIIKITNTEYYIYYTLSFDSKYKFIYMCSNKKIGDNYITVSKEIYETLNNLLNSKDFFGYIYIIEEKDTLSFKKLIYCSLNDNIQEYHSSLDDSISIDSFDMIFSEPVYHYIKMLISRNVVNLKDIEKNKIYDIVSFVKSCMYEIISNDNLFNDNVFFKEITKLEFIDTNKRRGGCLAFWFEDLCVKNYFKHEYLKIQKKINKITYYTYDVHKTQFLSLNYLSCYSYDFKICDKQIIPNILFISSDNKIVDDADDYVYFESMNDIEYYVNIPQKYLQHNIKNKYITFTLSIDDKFYDDNNIYIKLQKYNNMDMLYELFLVSYEELSILDNYIIVNDKNIEYKIKQMRENNHIPILINDTYTLQNFNIDSIQTLSSDICETDLKKNIYQKMLVNHLYFKYNVNMFDLFLYVQLTQTLLLYDIYYTIHVDKELIIKQINDNENIPIIHKQDILNKLALIPNNIKQTYDSLIEDYKTNYIQFFDSLKKIKTLDDLYNIENNIYALLNIGGVK